jgi:hypothetical protein
MFQKSNSSLLVKFGKAWRRLFSKYAFESRGKLVALLRDNQTVSEYAAPLRHQRKSTARSTESCLIFRDYV